MSLRHLPSFREPDDDERVARYTSARRAFVPRDDDVWVVTYPRSGTTWTLFLVHLLRNRGALDFAHLSDVAPWFEREVALGHKTAADLEALPSPRLFKSHLPYACMPARGRIVYVERDGRDVALSYFHLYESYLGYDDGFDAFFARFLEGDLQYRSWLAHTRAFEGGARDDGRVLALRYEDLQSDLEGQVRRLAAFLGQELDKGTLGSVLEKGRFEFMKQHEARFDFARVSSEEERHLEERRFLRQGRVGEGKAKLSEGQRRAFHEWLAHPPASFDEERDLVEFLR